MEKQQRHEKLDLKPTEIIGNAETVTDRCVNDNHCVENGAESLEVEVIHSPEESLKSLAIGKIERLKPSNEFFKSLPEYKNWLRLLSSKLN